MSAPDPVVDRMRDDFRTVVRDRQARGEWTADDKTEIEALIRQAIAGRNDDAGLLQCWADWLATEAVAIRGRKVAL